MSGKGFIPGPNALFDAWQKNFITVAHGYFPDWDLPPSADTEWSALVTTPGKKKLRWDGIWAIVSTKDFTHSQEVEMLDARKDYENGRPDDPADTSLRLFIKRYIRNNPRVTNQQKADMGLNIPDMVKSPAQGASGPNVLDEVTGVIKFMDHLKHISSITTPGLKTKGMIEGVEAIEVHVAFTKSDVTDAPAASEFRLDGEAKRGLYPRKFEEEQEGMRIWYKARKRFRGKTRTYGPFCVVWSALIS
jgi:hypothetical protein